MNMYIGVFAPQYSNIIYHLSYLICFNIYIYIYIFEIYTYYIYNGKKFRSQTSDNMDV